MNHISRSGKLLHCLSSLGASRLHRTRYSQFLRTASTLGGYYGSPVYSEQRNTFPQRSLTFGNYVVPVQAKRAFSSQRPSDEEDDGIGVPEEERGGESSEIAFPVTHSLPAAVVVPEYWPAVPLIPVTRNPVFPRFIKLLEVSWLRLWSAFLLSYFCYL